MTEVRLARAGFSSGHVRMWELDHKEGWALKKWGFQLWCWRKLSRVPWTARRSNPSILKESNPEYSLEGLMLKVKVQFLGQLMQRANLLEKTLTLGKTEGKSRRGWKRMRWLDGIIHSMDMSLSKLRARVKSREACVPRSQSQTRLSDWTTKVVIPSILSPTKKKKSIKEH